jgi:hypothetical protein
MGEDSPLNPPDALGGDRRFASLPFTRGGLGWGYSRNRRAIRVLVYTTVAELRVGGGFIFASRAEN